MSIYYQDQFEIYNKKKSLIKIGSRLITKKKINRISCLL